MIIVQDLIDEALIEELAPLNTQIVDLTAENAALTAQIGPLEEQIEDLEEQLANSQIAPVPSTWNTGYRGPITGATIASAVTADNVVIENKNIATMSGFVVTGANFTLRNCILTYTGAFGIDAQNGAVTIENCSLRPSGASAGPSFRGSGMFKGNKIDILPSGVGGIVLTGVSTVKDNYFADVAAGANFTSISGDQTGSTISNNTVA